MLGPGVSNVRQCCREQELGVRAPPRPQPRPRPRHRHHCSGRHFLLRESAWTGHKYIMKDTQYLIQNLENPAFPPQWSLVIGQGTMNWWNEMENTLPHGQPGMLSLLTLKLPPLPALTMTTRHCLAKMYLTPRCHKVEHLARKCPCDHGVHTATLPAFVTGTLLLMLCLHWQDFMPKFTNKIRHYTINFLLFVQILG